MLPQSVKDCLSERKYSIGIGSYSTYFFMDIKEKYDPHSGNRHICSLTYDQRTDHLAMSDRDGLDERLARFIQGTIDGLGNGKLTAEALREAFSELASSSGRF